MRSGSSRVAMVLERRGGGVSRAGVEPRGEPQRRNGPGSPSTTVSETRLELLGVVELEDPTCNCRSSLAQRGRRTRAGLRDETNRTGCGRGFDEVRHERLVAILAHETGRYSEFWEVVVGLDLPDRTMSKPSTADMPSTEPIIEQAQKHDMDWVGSSTTTDLSRQEDPCTSSRAGTWASSSQRPAAAVTVRARGVAHHRREVFPLTMGGARHDGAGAGGCLRHGRDAGAAEGLGDDPGALFTVGGAPAGQDRGRHRVNEEGQQAGLGGLRRLGQPDGPPAGGPGGPQLVTGSGAPSLLAGGLDIKARRPTKRGGSKPRRPFLANSFHAGWHDRLLGLCLPGASRVPGRAAGCDCAVSVATTVIRGEPGPRPVERRAAARGRSIPRVTDVRRDRQRTTGLRPPDCVRVREHDLSWPQLTSRQLNRPPRRGPPLPEGASRRSWGRSADLLPARPTRHRGHQGHSGTTVTNLVAPAGISVRTAGR